MLGRFAVSDGARGASPRLTIAAELDDLSLDLLHEAVAEGATKRPDADRALTQARRAVEKAAHLLGSLE